MNHYYQDQSEVGFMSTGVIVGILVVIMLAIMVFIFRGQGHDENMHKENKSDEIKKDNATIEEIIVVDEQGQEIIHARELEQVPYQMQELHDRSDVTVTQVKKLTDDLLKNTMKTSNKIVEIVFDPLQSQNEEKSMTEKNEVENQLSETVPVTTPVVVEKKTGQHIQQADQGHLKQLINSASHVLSISIAQKHRDVISHNLDEIKTSVDDLQTQWSDQERAELQGTVKYLEYLTSFMRELDSPENMPLEKRNQLEMIRREVMVWEERLRTKALRLKERVDAQKKEEWLRTGKTYNALLKHAKDVEDLVEKFDSFLKMVSLLDVGTVYLDPVGKSNSGILYIKSKDESFNSIKQTLEKLKEHSENYLSKGLFNRAITLQQRKDAISEKTNILDAEATENQTDHQETVDSLGGHLKKMQENGEKIRMVVEFDELGEIRKVGLL